MLTHDSGKSNSHELIGKCNRECSQVRMVDAISQPGCAECGAGGLVLTDYRQYAFLRALFKIHLMTHAGTSATNQDWLPFGCLGAMRL